MITQDRLKELLDYNPETGIFINRTSRRGQMAIGSVAGYVNPEGYRLITIDGHRDFAHRWAWFYMTGKWPENIIDHKDRNPSNNQWSNLRSATQRQNHYNCKAYSNNKCGLKGVSFHKSKQQWRATIRVNGKYKHVGYAESPEAAFALLPPVRSRLHGEFARHQ